MERVYFASIKLLLSACFGWALYVAITRPVTLGEALLWDHLVRPPFRQAFTAPDAWSGLLYAVIAKRTVGLFRLSQFTLRLPALIGCGVYLIVIFRKLPRRYWPILVLAAVLPVALGRFSFADPRSVALAFCALGWCCPRFAALFFGLAIGAYPLYAIPLSFLALRRGIAAIERIAIPAATVAFLLLIVPWSHAAPTSPTPSVGGREETAVRLALQPIRQLGAAPLRISVASSVLPLVEFYREKYRRRNWELTDREPQFRIAP
jgi:hypothetical protein